MGVGGHVESCFELLHLLFQLLLRSTDMSEVQNVAFRASWCNNTTLTEGEAAFQKSAETYLKSQRVKSDIFKTQKSSSMSSILYIVIATNQTTLHKVKLKLVVLFLLQGK